VARPLDLRQGGSRDEGQDEQEDGRHGEAEAHGDGLGDLVAVGLGLWSRRIGHYGERYTPVPGACRDDAHPVVVGPLLSSPDRSRPTTDQASQRIQDKLWYGILPNIAPAKR
jgi:hypothetical protein